MKEIVIAGCRPTPLASYLKGLGLLRVVALQTDPEARAWWMGEELHLSCTLDRDGLADFLCTRYQPSPVMNPWNGGSGFYWKWDEKKKAFKRREACDVVEALRGTTHPRLARYRASLDAVAGALWKLGDAFYPDKVDKKERDEALILRQDDEVRALAKERKDELLVLLRATLPDDVLEWFDVAFVLQPDGQATLPLLGSGGNDGNLDFSVTFMGRVLELVPLRADEPVSRRTNELVHDALYRAGSPPLGDFSPGQFDPSGGGGSNAAEGFAGPIVVNPWDFLLMVEGALLFAGSVARRLGAGRARAAFPFTVTQQNLTAAGAGSMAYADRDLARGETWLPLWSRPATFTEVARVFAEGRAQVGRRQAVTGLDFARATASLGVDRGIDAFERIGFMQRFGRMFIAASLGRVRVRLDPHVRLLDETDRFLDDMRRFCASKEATASGQAALFRLEDAMFRYCCQPSAARLGDVLAALGATERTVARSRRARDGVRRPIHGLSPAWLSAADDGSAEFDLAAAIASIRDDDAGPLRRNLEPVQEDGRAWAPDSPSTVWAGEGLTRNLVRVLERRLLDGRRAAGERDGEAREKRRNEVLVPLAGRHWASCRSVADFLEGRTDDDRIADLVWALAGLRWDRVRPAIRRRANDPAAIHRAYALLKLVLLPEPLRLHARTDPVTIAPEPAVVALLRAGRPERAVDRAVRRLRVSGLVPQGSARRDRQTALAFLWQAMDLDRIAAALLVPVAAAPLARLVLRKADRDGASSAIEIAEAEGENP